MGATLDYDEPHLHTVSIDWWSLWFSSTVLFNIQLPLSFCRRNIPIVKLINLKFDDGVIVPAWNLWTFLTTIVGVELKIFSILFIYLFIFKKKNLHYECYICNYLQYYLQIKFLTQSIIPVRQLIKQLVISQLRAFFRWTWTCALLGVRL